MSYWAEAGVISTMTSIDKIGIQPSNVDTNYKAIDPSTQMSDLDVICNKCTIYDSKSNIVKKVYFRYNARNEMFVCENCRRVVDEKQVRTALNLNQEEYIHYEKATPVQETLQKRQKEETFMIRPNNPVPLSDPSRRPRAVILNNRDRKNNNSRMMMEENDNDDKVYRQ